jgi:Putative GTPase activating protein for Arf
MVSLNTTEEIFRKIREDPSNQVCADCDSEEVKFASISHGSLICEVCASAHKDLGPSISFVKSLGDTWSIRQLKIMTAGGNSTLKNFFDNYNMPSTASIEFKYCTVAAKYYREMLKVMAEGEECTMSTPSIEEGLVLTNFIPPAPKVVEEQKQPKSVGSMFGSAFNATIGIGKNLYGKVKEIETYKNIENKAIETAYKLGEGIKWGAQISKKSIEKGVEIGKQSIGKGVEIGKESLEWGAHKGYEGLEWGASTGIDLGSKGVGYIKTGAAEALDTMTHAASNTYNSIKIGERTQKIKEESWNLLNTIEKNTIGMIIRKKNQPEEEEKELKEKIDMPERVPTPPEYQ